jgi:putative membrane protein
MLIAKYVPGIEVANLTTALITAVVLSVANLTIRPILFVLTLPLTLISFGLFSFIINALILWFVGKVVEGFEVGGFIPALIGATAISLVSYFISKIAK